MAEPTAGTQPDQENHATRPEGPGKDGPAEAGTAGASPASGEGPEPSAESPGTSNAGTQIEQARKEAAEHYDRAMRLQAEFENYKRRMHKEQSETLKFAQLPLLRDLAGVMDNLERAIGHARQGDLRDRQPFVDGLEMVTKQIGVVFERYGMTRILAMGEPFDPRKHEAMKVVETEEFPENTVVEEFQPGYQMHDRIVRPAMVVVSKKPQAAAGGDPSGSGGAR